MNILLVDGNEKEASDKYINAGMKTQYEVYETILKKNTKKKINVITIHPAINNEYLPKGLNLNDLNGIVWTGSALNIYNVSNSISKQIELAKELLERKNKIFGSCWGLQVLVTAAGGYIRKNPNGLEAVIAKNIKLNKTGLNHQMYKNKNKTFDALCWHYDDTETLPVNSKVLAFNEKSKFQSISFTNKNSKVWAVQYHPEFNPFWISKLMMQRKDILLSNKIYNSITEFENEKSIFENYNKIDLNKNKNKKYRDLFDTSYHSLEISNWLDTIF